MGGGGSEVIRFGILGCAAISQKLVRAINLTPNVEVAALGSRSLSKAKEFAANYNVPAKAKLYGSYEEVLEDASVDVVYIPLPTSLHVEWVVKAAGKQKHILLEKPAALTVEELDVMIQACEKNGLQLMDSTMWMHHPRTAKMEDYLRPELLGEVREVTTLFHYCSTFHTKDIRVKADLDGLGALGDIGWHCSRAILWANKYQLPETVTAHRGAKINSEGVITGCGATYVWKDGRVATFRCSFHSQMITRLTVSGTSGVLDVDDFVIPRREDGASFQFFTDGAFEDMQTTFVHKIVTEEVKTSLPQEALMLHQLASLVRAIRSGSGKPDPKWPTLTRKTQQMLNAVKTSIESGYATVIVRNAVNNTYSTFFDGLHNLPPVFAFQQSRRFVRMRRKKAGTRIGDDKKEKRMGFHYETVMNAGAPSKN